MGFAGFLDGAGRRNLSRRRQLLRGNQVAKTSPLEFMRQVQAETRKVVWPTRRETVMTAVMVLIMAILLGLFFFGVDSAFDAIVRFLLSLAD
jgi:preprotein translocase subunit SecE